MRVVAGTRKGRIIVAPAGSRTRPTSDRVREAVFSAILSRLGSLDELSVADLFAGSGALGIEALSRGAAHVTFVDNDPRALDAIRRNLRSLELETSSTVAALDARRLPAALLEHAPFALLFADPPYRIDTAQVSALVSRLAEIGMLAAGALVVYEHAIDAVPGAPHGFSAEPTRRYGSTGVTFMTCGEGGEHS